MNSVYRGIGNDERCYRYENYFLDNFNTRALKLFRIDHIRFLRLFEISYYIIIFSITTLFVGAWINSWFTLSNNEQTSSRIFVEVLAHMLVLGIAIFYINKIVLLFPFPFGQKFGYCPHNPKQISIATTVGQGIILFSTQVRLQDKVKILANRWDSDLTT